jgi:hypothetical protein
MSVSSSSSSCDDVEDDSESESVNESESESESESDDVLDLTWINEIENTIMYDEYQQFIKSDVTSVMITFIYINKSNEQVHTESIRFALTVPNQISQDEILHIMQKYQMRVQYNKRNKKEFIYYNFHSLLHYSFEIDEDVKSVAAFLVGDGHGDGHGDGFMNEYSNIISIQTLYFKPIINLFHDISSITIILYED